MNKYISDAKDKVYSQVSELITKSNTCTVDMVNCIDNISTDIKYIIDKVTVMGDMITDLRVLNGTAKSITSISDLPVVSNTGLSIKDGNISLSLYSETNKEVNAKNAVIVSTLPYTLYDVNKVSTDLDLLFKSNTTTTVAFDNSGYTFTVSMPFTSIEQINCIDVKLNLNTETYPIINSIKYVDQNNIIQDTPILDTQNKSINLDENRVVNNLYSININPVVTNQLLVEFVCKSGNTLTFDSINPKYNKRTTNGSIVLGPYASDEPILKLAIDSDTITTGVDLYVSGDKENWIPITSSSSFGSNKKILSFNTVSNNSQKLSEDLYRIYVKVDIASNKITNETSIVEVYDTYREDGVINTDTLSNIPDNMLSAYRLKSSDYFYGKYSYNSSCNMSGLAFNMIEQIDVEGIPKVIGMETTKYSVSNGYDSSLGIAAVGCELRSLRLPSSGVVDATGFDIANSKLVDIYPRAINQSVNVNQKDNLCFTLDVKEDLYTLISSTTRKSVVIDLTTPFIKNSSSALLQVPNEDIIIRDSLGKNILTITKDKLLNIDEVYFINLVGILFTPLIVEGLQYSSLYPIKQLQDNEYALQDGKVIAASGVIFNVQGYELLKTEVTCNRVVNYTNGNYIKRVDDSYAYHYEQELDIAEPITVLKLNNVSISKGSLIIEDLSQRQGTYINYKVTKLNYERNDKSKPYNITVAVSDNTIFNSDCYIQLTSNKDSAVIKDLGNLKYTVSNPVDTIITASIIYKGGKISSKSIKVEGIVGWSNTGFLDYTEYGQVK